MEMPDVIYGWIEKDHKYFVMLHTQKLNSRGETYHHDRVLKAKDAEIESLHLEIDENHKALRRWADSHEELRLEVELRAEIAKLEAIIESRGM